jgi:predicted Zn-dependent peptidase
MFRALLRKAAPAQSTADPEQSPVFKCRFEAHLEMHVGSVDELDHEQGVAHLIEHVTFLGSKKRERILGTGARSNAYTDFHHTVFHVHSPVKSQETGEALLPLVLDALHEVSLCMRLITKTLIPG